MDKGNEGKVNISEEVIDFKIYHEGYAEKLSNCKKYVAEG